VKFGDLGALARVARASAQLGTFWIRTIGITAAASPNLLPRCLTSFVVVVVVVVSLLAFAKLHGVAQFLLDFVNSTVVKN
jgi:hypothetical protein